MALVATGPNSKGTTEQGIITLASGNSISLIRGRAGSQSNLSFPPLDHAVEVTQLLLNGGGISKAQGVSVFDRIYFG